MFDFDGTLSKPNALPNSWARIWAKIGRTKDDETLYQMYKNKELAIQNGQKKLLKSIEKKNFQGKCLRTLQKVRFY